MERLHLLAHREKLAATVHPVPDAVDRRVAEFKLETLGIAIDALTDDQRAYLDAWRFDTIKTWARSRHTPPRRPAYRRRPGCA